MLSLVTISNHYNGGDIEARLGLSKEIKWNFTSDSLTVIFGLDNGLQISPALILLTKSAPDQGQLKTVPTEAPSYDGRVTGNVTWTGSGNTLRGTATLAIKSVRATGGVKYRCRVRYSFSDEKYETVKLVVAGKVFLYWISTLVLFVTVFV